MVVGTPHRSVAPVASGTAGAAGAAGEQTLALALVAAASAAGSWCALIGWEGLGVEAADALGVDLTRLAVVPRPGPAWAETTAAFLDGVDLVVLCPPSPPRPAMARRLVARARERRAVLMVLPGRSGWPEAADLQLHIEDPTWEGAESGRCALRRRQAAVVAVGRRQAGQPTRCRLWLPDADGSVRAVSDADKPEGI